MPMSQDFSKYQEGDPPGPNLVPAGTIISSDTHRDNRLPPGQVRTRKWPVLHWKRAPTIQTGEWSLFVRGLVDHPFELRWDEFLALPRVRVFSDFHCVTRWSRLGNTWEGVSAGEIIRRAGVQPAVRFVIAHGFDDGFTTNMPYAEFNAEDVLLAFTHDGDPISTDHGGPVRLVVPKLYAWKSAKWLSGLEFVAEDRSGLWEKAGYHDHGDPWREERHQPGW